MQRFGSQHLVFDNAGCFSKGPMPAIGNHFTFGTFDVYVAIAQPFVYPQVVHVAEDPPCHLVAHGRRTTRPVSCEVMMATLGPATEADAAEAEAVAERTRMRRSKPPYEREQNREEQVGTSAGPRDPIQLVVRELEKPVEAGADPALIEKQLEGGRLRLLHGAEELQQSRDMLNRNIREYNIAHGYTLLGRPSRLEEVRARGGNLAKIIERDGKNCIRSIFHLHDCA